MTPMTTIAETVLLTLAGTAYRSVSFAIYNIMILRTILPLTGIIWSEYPYITGESQAYEYCMIDDRPFDPRTKNNAGRYTRIPGKRYSSSVLV